MIRRFASGLLSGIFPQICLSCNSLSEDPVRGAACSECWDRTRIFRDKEILCGKCGAFFGEANSRVSVNCPHCRDHSYDRAFALGIYEFGLRANVIQLKTTPKLRRGISDLIVRTFEQNHSQSTAFDLIIPVPLSKKRSAERGFNQASVIARFVGRSLNIDVDELSLIRVKHTNSHRAGMDQKARSQSVAKAFEVTRPRLIEGKTVLLIDDVFTSGATASSCAEVLKKAGSGKVEIFTLARAYIETNS